MMRKILNLATIIVVAGISGFFALEIVGILQDVVQWLFQS